MFNERRNNSRGFTIVQLAVMTVLIGVILLMTLKGSAMVESMRALAVSYQLAAIQRQILTYQVTYSNFPGDDPSAHVRWRRDITLTPIAGVVASTEGNSELDGLLYDTGGTTGEQFTAWRDLRFAGITDGDPALQGIAALPENPFGGFYGFDVGNLGQKGGSLCATRIPGRAAQQIDERLDDGSVNTGKMVATSKFSIEQGNHFDAPDKAPYSIENEYIICIPMLP